MAEVVTLYDKYKGIIPEADTSLLDNLNGIFVWNSDDADRELFVRRLMESYSPDTIKMLVSGICTPGMSVYQNEWHMLLPVVTDVQRLEGVLNWTVAEMENRQHRLMQSVCRNIHAYNRKSESENFHKIPHLVLVVDEASALLQDETSRQCNLFAIQKLILNGRACGVHTIFFSGYTYGALFDRMTSDLLRERTMPELLSLFDSGNRRVTSIAEVDNMTDGHSFERYTAKLLTALDYSDVTVTQASGDYGVDVLASKDGMRFAIQCKCYSQPLGIKAVQEVHSGKIHYNCDVAVVLTNNEFTDESIRLARETGVVLWNRAKLIQMMNKAGI